MVTKVQFDYAELEKYATALGARADQIPYALSLALNRSADVTRNYLIKATWPGAVQQRNNSFIAASLTTKEARASKQSLSVEIYDKLGRGNLKLHALGGTRTAKGTNIAIPVSSMQKTSHGVPTRMRPRNLANSFKKDGMIYQKTKGGRLRLVYSLKRKANIPKQVPFYEDFGTVMLNELERNIPLAVAKAMSTAR
jgi:hypothetical protein